MGAGRGAAWPGDSLREVRLEIEELQGRRVLGLRILTRVSFSAVVKDPELARLEAEYGDVGAGPWPPARPRPARKWWAAVLLSLLVPGLGQVYNGDLRRGLRLWTVLIALVVVSSWLGLLDHFAGLVLVTVAGVGLQFYILFDAWNGARRVGELESPRWDRWWVYVGLIVLSLVVVTPGVRWVLPVRTYFIPAGSMEPTVKPGDHLVARVRGPGLGEVERGDVVILRSPEDPAVEIVKRIVGLPGEELDIRDKVVYIDAEPLDEEAFAWFADSTLYPDSSAVPGLARLRDQFGPFVIPEGAVFVLGDNRDQSYDSRFLGPVPLSYLRGKPLYIHWNRDRSRIGRRIE